MGHDRPVWVESTVPWTAVMSVTEAWTTSTLQAATLPQFILEHFDLTEYILHFTN